MKFADRMVGAFGGFIEWLKAQGFGGLEVVKPDAWEVLYLLRLHSAYEEWHEQQRQLAAYRQSVAKNLPELAKAAPEVREAAVAALKELPIEAREAIVAALRLITPPDAQKEIVVPGLAPQVGGKVIVFPRRGPESDTA